MKTAIVIGIVLLSLATIAPMTGADGTIAGDATAPVTAITGCAVVDPSSTPPVRTEPCNVG